MPRVAVALTGGRIRRRRRPVLVGLLILVGLAGIAWLWWTAFRPLMRSPREWGEHQQAFREVLREVLLGPDGEQAPPSASDLPAWPDALDGTAHALVACAEARVARGVQHTGQYHGMDYPWGDVPDHLGTPADLVIRCLREIGLDLQQLVHIDRVRHPERYPLHLWRNSEPDTSMDHRRMPILVTFLRQFAPTMSVRARKPEERASFQPGDVVFWTPAGAGQYPTLAGIVLDRRDREGVPRVVTHVPEQGWVTDHHRLTDWRVTSHLRIRPDALLERFLAENPAADLVTRAEVERR